MLVGVVDSDTSANDALNFTVLPDIPVSEPDPLPFWQQWIVTISNALHTFLLTSRVDGEYWFF